MLYVSNPPFDLNTHNAAGLGGSENGFIRTAEWLLKLGHTVHVFNRIEQPPVITGNLTVANLAYLNRAEPYDVVYSLRHKEPFNEKFNTRLKVLFLADIESVGLINYIQDHKIDLVMGVSLWQSYNIMNEEKISPDRFYVTSNGVVDNGEVNVLEKVKGRCIHLATPDRGIPTLLDIWPRIKERVPWATLHVYTSFMGWGVSAEENEKLCKDLYARIDSMSRLGVSNRKHGNADEIRKAQKEAQVYLYPTDFRETCCMSVLESMLCGSIPVATAKAALIEKILPGVTGFPIPDYGASTTRYQDLFVEAAVRALTMEDEKRLYFAKNARNYALNFTYDKMVPEWVSEWERRLK